MITTNKDSPEKIKQYRALINEYFQTNNNYGKYSFKSIFRKQINAIVSQFFNILVYYFDKYSEREFHKRMNNKYILKIKSRDGIEPPRQVTLDGFDFLGDWSKFHKYKYMYFIKSVRAVKDWFIFDEEKINEILLKILETKGWTISDLEKKSIRYTVRRLYNVLYLGYDSID